MTRFWTSLTFWLWWVWVISVISTCYLLDRRLPSWLDEAAEGDDWSDDEFDEERDFPS